MALVPERIESFLQAVPRAQRTVTDDDPVERYFDLDAYYGGGSDDNRSRRSGYSSTRTPGLVTDTATSPSAGYSDESSPAQSPISSGPDDDDVRLRPRAHASSSPDTSYRGATLSSSGTKQHRPHRHQHKPQHHHHHHHHHDHDQQPHLQAQTQTQPQHDYYHQHHNHNHNQDRRGGHRGRDTVSTSTRKTLEEIRKQDGHVIWPQADPSQSLPRNAVLHLNSSSKKKTRRSSSPASRQVKNPAETAQIRKVGACIKCRIEKLKCTDGGICGSCQSKYGSPLCQRTCLRKTLTETARHTTSVRYTGLCYGDELAMLRSRGHLERDFRESYLSFSGRDWRSPAMRIVFQQSADPELVAFSREHIPSHEQLVSWAESRIDYERRMGLTGGFEASIECFIMHYVRAGSSLPQISLLKKIHTMRCMYRIWKMDNLYWYSGPDPGYYPLPGFIHAELRQIVRKALESAERDIFAELDKFLKPAGIPAKDRAPMWAGLWQLIFTLKDLTNTFREANLHMTHGTRRYNAHPDFTSAWAATEEMFVAVLSYYGSHYRKASNLQVTLQCIDSSHIPVASHRREVDEAFKAARLDRSAFHDAVRSSVDDLDQLLKTLVVDHEVKRLRRSRGRSNTHVVTIQSHDMYDSDEDGDINMMY